MLYTNYLITILHVKFTHKSVVHFVTVDFNVFKKKLAIKPTKKYYVKNEIFIFVIDKFNVIHIFLSNYKKKTISH